MRWDTPARQKSMRRLRAEFPIYIAVIAMMTVGYALGVQAFAGALVPADTRYYVPPNQIVLLGLSLFPSVVLASLIGGLVFDRIWRPRRKPLKWNTACSVWAACSIGMLAVGVLIGVSTVGRVTDDAVIWRDAFDPDYHQYSWSQVLSAEMGTDVWRNNRLGWVVEPHLWLVFSDGRRADFWPAYQPIDASKGEAVITVAQMVAARGIPARGASVPPPQTNDFETRLYDRVAAILNPSPVR